MEALPTRSLSYLPVKNSPSRFFLQSQAFTLNFSPLFSVRLVDLNTVKIDSLAESPFRNKEPDLTKHYMNFWSQKNYGFRSIMIVTLLCGASLTLGHAATTDQSIQYNRDIRPILAENCFSCHGPDSAARKSGLRLDKFEDAIAPRKESKPAFIPGKADESEAISRIFTTDEDDVMPPRKTKKTLKPEEKELLKKWVAAGAKYEPHWSFITPSKPAPPVVKNPNWVRNPIDAFILSRLDEAGIVPAGEADRRTLVRRVSLDLTGLPPTPEVVEKFVADKSKNAYEELVDELLTSKRFGEHRARYWLDAARYADTHGIHIDNYREIWPYRDWVINAFNRNMPFDQFTTEQLAGDLLPNPTLDQRIATGFNRCNITTSEGGAINEEYLVLYARDRTETTSQVWMGLTTGCAVCHDHKFDPITQKEFYSLSAFFNNTTQPAMDGNKKDTPPIIVVPDLGERAKFRGFQSEKTGIQKVMDARREASKPDFTCWVAEVKPADITPLIPYENLIFQAPLNEGSTSNFTFAVGGQVRHLTVPTNAPFQTGIVSQVAFTTSKEIVPSLTEVGNFEKDKPFSVAVWVRMDPDNKTGSLLGRMHEENGNRGWDIYLEGGKPAFHLVSKWPDNALKVVSKKELTTNKWAHIAFTYDGSGKAEGVKAYHDGEVQDTDRPYNKLTESILAKTPFKIGQRSTGTSLLKAGVQDIRIYSRVLPPTDVKSLQGNTLLAYVITKPEASRTKDEKKAVFESFLTSFDSNYMAEIPKMAKVDGQIAEVANRSPLTHVMQEKPEPAFAFVLNRGEYDKKKDKVWPTTPASLPHMAKDSPTNRLGLAKWLLAPENPLTSRVTVNRFWQEIFGTGIVKSSGDFGVTGDSPSHPELLDWLAVDFRENGWDVKRLIKTMVMSSAYRQAAISTPEKIAADPDNRLLSRGPRFRMDAEMIRDYALMTSGLLNDLVGGPSVKPYQPSNIWETVAMPNSDTHDYKRDSGEKLYRRSMYTFWKRTAPPATMDILNAPSREGCTVKRERTNTPLQALATLNDPQFVEASRHLAELALEEAGKSKNSRIDFMAEKVLGRTLRPNEKDVVKSVLDNLEKHYTEDIADAKVLIQNGESKPDPKLNATQLAAYTMVANTLFNLDEALNK